MSADYSIDRKRRIVMSRHWGVVTDADVDEYRRRLRADPGFDPTYHYIVDLREVTVMAISAAKVRHVAATQIFRGGQRRAIVTSSLEQYGMARMFATYAALEGEIVEVFRDWDAAVSWVGAPVESALGSSGK